MTPRRVAVLLTVVGVGCVVAAAWLFHMAAGLAVLGVALTGVGLLAIPTGEQ